MHRRQRRRLRSIVMYYYATRRDPGSGGTSVRGDSITSIWGYQWSALHPSGVAKSSTSFGKGKGGNVTSAGLQPAGNTVRRMIPYGTLVPVAVRRLRELLYTTLLYFTYFG